MPYIDQAARKRLANGGEPETAGELNYLVTRLVDRYLSRTGVKYASINEVVGVLECAKHELYRRVASAYEDEKRVVNGEVYGRH